MDHNVFNWRDFGIVIRDPYTCLNPAEDAAIKDSELWLDLLRYARDENFELFAILNYLRGTGVELVPSKKHGYRLVPIYADNAWISEKQYNEEKQYLVPYIDTLQKLLRRLAEENA